MTVCDVPRISASSTHRGLCLPLVSFSRIDRARNRRDLGEKRPRIILAPLRVVMPNWRMRVAETPKTAAMLAWENTPHSASLRASRCQVARFMRAPFSKQ